MLLTMAPKSSTGSSRSVARGHFLALDGVRGLAILMVICSHAFRANYDSGGRLIRLIGHVFYYGLFGVDLFFVLSGFLITGILFDSLRDSGYFRKFYARRALRIFPLYYGVLFVCLALTHALHLKWGNMGWLLVFYLQNLEPAKIVTFSPGHSIDLFHFWSLAVEEQFYLVWPAIVLLVRDGRKLLMVTVAGSVGALLLRLGLLTMGASGFAMHVTTACRADSLLLGGALAMLYRLPEWERMQRFAAWGVLYATAVMAVAVVLLEPRLEIHPFLGNIWREGFRYTVLAVGFCCLIAWSLRANSVCQRLFEFRSLRFLGKYSYGIYVLHVFVLSLLVEPLRASLFELTQSKLISVAVAGVVSLALSIAAAYASYNLYEKRFLRLKHRFDYSRKVLNHGAPEDALVSTV
jgi:peptidoglycan/LPS O-acetylase OafA/YrhL